MEVLSPEPLNAVRASLAEAGGEESAIALQSTVATAKKAVTRALARERAAEEAALSLAQRQRLSMLCSQLQGAEDLLEQSLTERGRRVAQDDHAPSGKLRRLLRNRRTADERAEWSEALINALDSLDAGVTLLNGLARGQPRDTAARAVAESTARLLAGHRDSLREASAHLGN